MEEFKKRIDLHIEHVKKVGLHCATEETTKQALILPLLDILGFSPYDPTRVQAEYAADFPGVKATERVDYTLFSAGIPVIFIEAKGFTLLQRHTGSDCRGDHQWQRMEVFYRFGQQKHYGYGPVPDDQL